MAKPKVVVVGAGSFFFGRKAIWGMIHLDGLTEGTLSLVETDARRLEKLLALARRAVESAEVSLRIEGTTEVREALPNADFVVLSFSNRNAHYRKIDCEVSAKFGIRMCSGDTIGPGGIFRAMRELPEILRTARLVEELCPQAWVINYINPSTVNGIALMRHTRVKSFALCDSLHMPYVKSHYREMAGLAKEEEKDFHLEIAGVNHFTWVLEASFRGRDLSPEIRKAMKTLADQEQDEGYAKSRFNNTYSLELWDTFGACPACVAHTKEYLPYWQGASLAPRRFAPLTVFDADERVAQTEQAWEEISAYGEGSKPIETFHEKTVSDHATDIIRAMWTRSGEPFYLNVPNRGAVGNLPDDAFLELLCDVDLEHGPRPRKVNDFPLGLRGLQMGILDVHELTVEAIVRNDRNLLRRAMMTDPLVRTIEDGDAVIEELLEREKEALEFTGEGTG